MHFKLVQSPFALTPNPSPERAFGTGRGAKISTVAVASPVSQPRSGGREKGVRGMRAKSH